MDLYTCVVDDSPAVPAVFKEAQGTASMFDAMNGVFLRKRSKLSDAVWSMVEKVRASFMADDCWRRRRGGGGGREGRRPAVGAPLLTSSLAAASGSGAAEAEEVLAGRPRGGWSSVGPRATFPMADVLYRARNGERARLRCLAFAFAFAFAVPTAG